jgi:hypothetical protein
MFEKHVPFIGAEVGLQLVKFGVGGTFKVECGVRVGHLAGPSEMRPPTTALTIK